METSVLGSKASQIWMFDGLLERAFCEKFVDELGKVYSLVSQRGMTMGGVLSDTKTSMDCFFTQSKFREVNVEWTDFFQDAEMQFLEALRKGIAIVKNGSRSLFSWSAIDDTGFQIQKYPQCEGFYREHIDAFPSTPTDSRVLSVIVYLNDVDFGGETAFPLHEVAVKPVAGRIIMFPSVWTHPHEGRTPISGDKWILNTFITNNEPHSH